MKKLNLLFALLMISVLGYGQTTFSGVSWVNWAIEPDYPEVTGYAANPYDNPTYNVYKAPASWTEIADNAAFDATWDLLGEPNNVNNLTSNGIAGDIFDLGEGNTFGAQWKAVHDGANVHVLLKYWDLNGQADAGSMSFEIMSQPTSPVRHEPSFTGAQDSLEAVKVAYENMAYARFIELGGGKALFKDGAVTEFAASAGLVKTFHAGSGLWRGGWGANEAGLESFLDQNLYWDMTDGVLRAVLIFSFDGALSYPVDPANMAGERTAIQVGETFAFDVKSNATIGGTANDNKVEYFWASDKNNGYASNYYSGHLTLKNQVIGETPAITFSGVSWVNWAIEPDYPEVTGYAANPYDNPTYTVLQAPAGWTEVADNASFDATWDLLGDPNNVSNLTSNGVAGDIFDIGEGNTFGAQWKAVHDGANLHLLLKYWDLNSQADAGSLSFEVMTQPTSPVRHETSFVGAQDSLEAVKVAYENMAYARYIELGGGKALFKDGAVTEFAGSAGLVKTFHEASGLWRGGWGANEAGLESFLDQNLYWNSTDGVIRAVLIFSFDGALSYPVDPANMAGERTAIQVGETLALDVKSNAAIGGTANDNKIEYFWSADKNNGYASNYYSGHLTLSAEIVPTNVENPFVANNNIRAFVYNGILYIKGDQPANVEVYNIIGAKLKSAEAVNQLNLRDLNNGIYIVRLNGEAEAIKVVKR
jgi:hypothetical protein